MKANCDGDGTPSTQNDKNVLTEYLDKNRLTPGRLESYKTERRENWLSKMLSIINDQ